MQDVFSHFKLSNLILCAGTLLKKNNKIILLKNNKTNEIVLPKGKLEKKESLIETAERETYEETGYNCKTISKKPFCMTI